MTLQEVTVDKNYKWNGKYLHEITIPGGTLIVMIRRGTSTIIPAGDTKGLRGRCACVGKVLRQDILPFCVFRNSFIFIRKNWKLSEVNIRGGFGMI